MSELKNPRLWMAGAILVTSVLGSTGCMSRAPRVIPPPDQPLMPPSRVKYTPPAKAAVQEEKLTFTATELDAPVETSLPVVAVPAVTPSVTKPEGATYVVKKGDLLSGIAYKHGLNWRDLAEYNNLADANRIKAGDKLIIPPYAKKQPAGTGSSAPTTVAVAVPVSGNSGASTSFSGDKYVVQSGDSLWLVARKLGTTVAKLKKVNNLDNNRLLVGQTLIAPGASVPATDAGVSTVRPSPSTTVTPSVVPTPRPVISVPTPRPVAPVTSVAGATGGSSIAEMFDRRPDPIQPEADTADDKAFSITVEEGETLEEIARSYIVPLEKIRELNKLGPNATVKAGDTLLIPAGIY